VSLNGSTKLGAVEIALGELHNRVLIGVRREIAVESTAKKLGTDLLELSKTNLGPTSKLVLKVSKKGEFGTSFVRAVDLRASSKLSLGLSQPSDELLVLVVHGTSDQTSLFGVLLTGKMILEDLELLFSKLLKLGISSNEFSVMILNRLAELWSISVTDRVLGDSVLKLPGAVLAAMLSGKDATTNVTEGFKLRFARDLKLAGVSLDQRELDTGFMDRANLIEARKVFLLRSNPTSADFVVLLTVLVIKKASALTELLTSKVVLKDRLTLLGKLIKKSETLIDISLASLHVCAEFVALLDELSTDVMKTLERRLTGSSSLSDESFKQAKLKLGAANRVDGVMLAEISFLLKTPVMEDSMDALVLLTELSKTKLTVKLSMKGNTALLLDNLKVLEGGLDILERNTLRRDESRTLVMSKTHSKVVEQTFKAKLVSKQDVLILCLVLVELLEALLSTSHGVIDGTILKSLLNTDKTLLVLSSSLVVLSLETIVLNGELHKLGDTTGSKIDLTLFHDTVVELGHIDDHGLLIELLDLSGSDELLQAKVLLGSILSTGDAVNGIGTVKLVHVREQSRTMLVNDGAECNTIVERSLSGLLEILDFRDIGITGALVLAPHEKGSPGVNLHRVFIIVTDLEEAKHDGPKETKNGSDITIGDLLGAGLELENDTLFPSELEGVGDVLDLLDTHGDLSLDSLAGVLLLAELLNESDKDLTVLDLSADIGQRAILGAVNELLAAPTAEDLPLKLNPFRQLFV